LLVLRVLRKRSNNYAPDDLLAYRIDKRMQELYQKLERAYIMNNFRYAGTANVGRLSGGLDYWVYDKNNLSSAAIDFDTIEDSMQEKFVAFGMSNTPGDLWCNAWVKRKVSSWAIGTIRTERTETVVGNHVSTLDTEFGILNMNLDHLILSSTAWLLRMDKLMMAPLNGRGFAEYDASVPGEDAMRRRILGEYVFIVKGESASADGLATKFLRH